MPFPAGKKPTIAASSSTTTSISKLDNCSSFLNSFHGGNYLIFNLSEQSYDYSKFNNGSVVEYKFPGLPAPPLATLFNICIEVENWLEASDEHVAVIHCVTGKGNTWWNNTILCVCDQSYFKQL